MSHATSNPTMLSHLLDSDIVPDPIKKIIKTKVELFTHHTDAGDPITHKEYYGPLSLLKSAYELERKIDKAVKANHDYSKMLAEWDILLGKFNTFNEMLAAFDNLDRQLRELKRNEKLFQFPLGASPMQDGVIDADKLKQSTFIKALNREAQSNMNAMVENMAEFKKQLATASTFDAEGIKAASDVFRGISNLLTATSGDPGLAPAKPDHLLSVCSP